MVFPTISPTLLGSHTLCIAARAKLTHNSADQRGVSGSVTRGCEALIVSGNREDGLGHDEFTKLTYAVESGSSGGALLLNWKDNIPVRVFRSSKYKDPKFKAQKLNKKGATYYRYDGIYKVVRGEYMNECGQFVALIKYKSTAKRLYQFYLERIPVGDDLYCSNRVSDHDALAQISETASELFAKTSR